MSQTPARSVVWHDLECGGYRADLPLWRELAAAAALPSSDSARVLDVGAGSGRVALDLARGGHEVTAIDREPALLAALRERAAGLPVFVLEADARDFVLEAAPHDLCVVPMQTVQLLRGAGERGALFARSREQLRPGGRFACAIVIEVDGFDSRTGGLGPAPERVEIDGTLYMSRAVRVAREREHFAIERERLVIGAGSEPAGAPEHDCVELEILSSEQLREELLAAGFEPEPTRTIAETDEYSGSEVVIARA